MLNTIERKNDLNQNFELRVYKQIKFLKCKALDNTNLVIHAFSTRLGGVSKSPFSSLNLSYNVNDQINCVLENRKIILDLLKIDYRDIVSTQQIHKDRITIVKEKDRGKGAFVYSDAIKESDALITNLPRMPLLMCYADCVPIFILDPIKKVIGLIHSGRKGTKLELTLKTIWEMREIFKIDLSSCLAAIFPSIGPCCYSIKNKIDNYDQEGNEFRNKLFYNKNKNEYFFDLKKENYLQLIKAGLAEKNIYVNEICTADQPELFFSYRRDKGNTGRMAAIFMLNF
jgi:YfiH family protein